MAGAVSMIADPLVATGVVAVEVDVFGDGRDVMWLEGEVVSAHREILQSVTADEGKLEIADEGSGTSAVLTSSLEPSSSEKWLR